MKNILTTLGLATSVFFLVFSIKEAGFFLSKLDLQGGLKTFCWVLLNYIVLPVPCPAQPGRWPCACGSAAARKQTLVILSKAGVQNGGKRHGCTRGITLLQILPPKCRSEKELLGCNQFSPLRTVRCLLQRIGLRG